MAASNMVIKYKNKEFPVPVGFTPADHVESMAMVYPELTNAKIIQDAEGVFTVKALTGENG